MGIKALRYDLLCVGKTNRYIFLFIVTDYPKDPPIGFDSLSIWASLETERRDLKKGRHFFLKPRDLGNGIFFFSF